MLYELRIYEPVEGKTEAVHEAFEKLKPVAERHGVTPIAIWEAPLERDLEVPLVRQGIENAPPDIGQDKRYILYLLGFKDLDDRKRAWSDFRSDPEVAQIVAPIKEREGGPIEAKITNFLLNPASYSPIQ
jgi:hypothetical protein